MVGAGCASGGGANDPSSSSAVEPTKLENAAGPAGDGPVERTSGATAPSFTLETLDGDSVSLSDYQGDKVVLIDFWATTCKPCLAEMPELVELYERKKAEGLEVLAISADGPETLSNVQATVKRLDMSFPILLDTETEVMDRYNPKGELPFTVVINRRGEIIMKRASFQAGDTQAIKTLEAAVDKALADK
ncbi:MAG: TlpA disulfide reductase family protein [Myxococcota bacterium]